MPTQFVQKYVPSNVRPLTRPAISRRNSFHVWPTKDGSCDDDEVAFFLAQQRFGHNLPDTRLNEG